MIDLRSIVIELRTIYIRFLWRDCYTEIAAADRLSKEVKDMKKHMFLKSIAAVVTVIGIISSSTIQVKQVNAETTNQYIERVCQIALNEVGYIEKKRSR